MPTIQVQSEVSLDALLDSVAQLDTTDLEQFADRVLAIRAKRRAPNLPNREANLLQQINQAVSAELQSRFDDLVQRREAGILTHEEHQELLQMVDVVEQIDVRRMEALAELAQLRNVPLRELMKQLGILTSSHA